MMSRRWGDASLLQPLTTLVTAKAPSQCICRVLAKGKHAIQGSEVKLRVSSSQLMPIKFFPGFSDSNAPPN